MPTPDNFQTSPKSDFLLKHPACTLGQGFLGKGKMETYIEDPRFFLYDLNLQRGAFEFVEADRQTLSAKPFLDKRFFHYGENYHSFPFVRVLDHIKDRDCERSPHNLNFIFHGAFCCSTLLAKCLDVHGKNLSLKEPMALVSLSEIKNTFFNDNPSDPKWAAIVNLTLDLLGRQFTDGEKILIKPSNSANVLINDVLADTKFKNGLLMYCSLERFLVSVIHGGRERELNINSLLLALIGNLKEFLPDNVPDVFTMSGLEKGTLLWGLQMQKFRQVVDKSPADNLKTLDCDVFLNNPAEVLGKLSNFFDLEISSSEISDILKSPTFLSHSKDPSMEFSQEAWLKRKNQIYRYSSDRIEEATKFAEKLGFSPNPHLPSAIFS